jgi:hypothetical protein
MLTRCCSLLLASVSSFAATPMLCGRLANPVAYERFLSQGEPYSLATCADFDPVHHFEETKMDLELAATESIKLRLLGTVAKAALEAGLNDEAKSYADQALAMAAEDRFKNARPITFESAAEGDAVFLGNLVLGRLALLDDNVEAAEKYLLLSGQITNGQPTFWGPNMTLARELLKRNRSKVVLQFLEEVKRFWRLDCAGPQTADKWAAIILAGKLPDYNLTYY